MSISSVPYTRAKQFFTIFWYNDDMSRKYLGWLWTGLGGLLLTLLYAVTRLTNLTKLPIFTDEAIYIRWSQIGAQDPNWRFISLTDGKQPMFTWVMMILLKALKFADPLFVGRSVSVLSGFGTLIGVWVLTLELFRSRRTAWFAAFLYVLYPFTLWYDRMALYDSMVAMFSVWGLYLAVLMVRRLKLDIAMILGLVVGAGMLNKSSGFLTLYFLPVTLLLFDWSHPKRWMRLMRWVGLAVVAAVLSQIVYSVLRLSPFFHIVSEKNNVFLFTTREWLNQPFRFLQGNLRGMSDWVRHYMTLPLFAVAVAPVFTRWKYVRERWLLYFWFVLPFVALANFAKILYPRFILFMTVPLLVVAADSFLRLWDGMKKPVLKVALALLVAVPVLWISYPIVANPIAAPIPASDRYQYMDDWPAGGGVPEVVSYLTEQARQGNISVYTEGTFGLMPYSIEIYLVDNPGVHIKGIWPLPKVMPDEIKRDALTKPTYFILNETQVAPRGWPLTLIGEYQKGRRTDRKLRFYRVTVPLAVAI